MRKQTYLIISIFLFFLSCQGIDENEKQDFSWQLVKTDEISINLDNTQGFFKSGISQFEASGKHFLSYFNQQTGVVYTYDLRDRSNIEKIQLEREGPNGIGTNLSQILHHRISADSILLINDWEKKFILVNNKGQVLRKYNLMTSNVFEEEGPILLTITNDNRPYVINNTVYINCEYNPDQNYTNKGVLLALDLENGKFTTSITPPKSYSEQCWGLAYSLNIFHIPVDTKTGLKRYYSFGIDPNIYVYDEDQIILSKTANSVYIDNLEPYSYNVKDYKDMDSWNKRKSHSLLNPKYYKLLFLKESKIFLREVFLNRSADELAQGISGLKKSMMILDQNLNLLGEYEFPKGRYFTSNYILMENGIYIANYEKYNYDENTLTFDFYEPQKIN